MREETALLNHVTDSSPKFHHVPKLGALPQNEDAAPIRPGQAIHETKGCRLARARGSEKGQNRARLDRDGDAIENGRPVAEAFAHVLEIDEGVH